MSLAYNHEYRKYLERVDEIRPFLSDFWWDALTDYHRIFQGGVPRDFQQIPFKGGIVCNGMLSMVEQIREMKSSAPLLGSLLAQGAHWAGSPATTVHHLWQFEQWLAEGHTFSTVLEWGGGYGDMTRVIKRCNGGVGTYVIVDIPFMSLLQHVWLESMNVRVRIAEDDIQEGVVNLVPLTSLDALDGFQPDLFASNYALSESSAFAQEYVEDREFYHARHLFLSYEMDKDLVPDSRPFGKRVRQQGRVIPINPLYASGEILVS